MKKVSVNVCNIVFKRLTISRKDESKQNHAIRTFRMIGRGGIHSFWHHVKLQWLHLYRKHNHNWATPRATLASDVCDHVRHKVYYLGTEQRRRWSDCVAQFSKLPFSLRCMCLYLNLFVLFLRQTDWFHRQYNSRIDWYSHPIPITAEPVKFKNTIIQNSQQSQIKINRWCV